MLRRPLQRILVEGDAPAAGGAADDEEQGGEEGKAGRDGWDIATFPAWPLPGSGGASGSQQAPPAPAPATVVAATRSGGDMVQQPTWAPAGGLVAFTEVWHAQVAGLWEMANQVVVADGRTGRRLVELRLAEPYPPFYFMWLPCSTRLLLLRWA